MPHTYASQANPPWHRTASSIFWASVLYHATIQLPAAFCEASSQQKEEQKRQSDVYEVVGILEKR